MNIRKTIKNMTTKKPKLKELYIVGGTNDASIKKQPDKIIHEDRQFLIQVKQKAVMVIMSSILPRQDANKTEE